MPFHFACLRFPGPDCLAQTIDFQPCGQAAKRLPGRATRPRKPSPTSTPALAPARIIGNAATARTSDIGEPSATSLVRSSVGTLLTHDLRSRNANPAGPFPAKTSEIE